ncbi:transposase [Arthrobacter sp. MYb222]|uniref:transposase n=1 Tax=Arthrobacter sp. MYb222 TaxID=1848599 RepID=UPI000CFC534A|nr:hypothetical protein CQ016_10945 [Arthrobacter sp. MYb222]
MIAHPWRLRSGAAFTSLAGVNPILAASRDTMRRRLNRKGNRKLIKTLHIAALVRKTYGGVTRAYAEQPIAEGKKN